MKVNNANPAQTVQQASFGKKEKVEKEPKVKLEASEDSVEISKGNAKPKFGKAWAKGYLYKLAAGIPFIGSYLIGKKIAEQDNIQEALASGNKEKANEEPGAVKSWWEGTKVKLSKLVPFYGTYKVGKEIVEQKNIQEALKTGDNAKAQEKPKFWKAWGEGLKMGLSQLVPFYGTYRYGKEIETHNIIDKQM